MPHSQTHRLEWELESGLTRQEGMEQSTVERACCVHDYYVYKGIWEAAVGEILACKQEPRNAADQCTVAVKKDGTIIGHLSRKVSHVYCRCRMYTGGIANEPSDAIPNNQLHFVLCMCENVLTITIFR